MCITVLFLDHTAELGGAEIDLIALMTELDRTRIRPIIVLAEEGPLVSRLRDLNVETHVLPLAKGVQKTRKEALGGRSLLRIVSSTWSILSYSRRIARFARANGVSIVHTNSLKSDLYGGLAGKLARIPVIWRMHDHIDPTYLPRPAVFLFRFLATRWPTLVIANSQSALSSILPHSGRGKVIYPGLTAQKIELPNVQEQIRQEGPARIGLVGRLMPWKGQHVFLEAAAQVIQKGNDARFLIIGGPLFGQEAYEAQLRAQTKALGIEAQVEFCGFQKDVPAWMQKLDILVHTSIIPEPFGLVLIEGMAQGLPVIASDGGGPREIITPGENGLLTPLGNVSALADAIETLLHDPAQAKRLGNAAFHHVRRHFSAQNTARRMEQVYAQICHTQMSVPKIRPQVTPSE